MWIRPALLAGLVALIVAACGGPTPPVPTGLFGDSDLSSAQLLEVTDPPPALKSISAADLAQDRGLSRLTVPAGALSLPHQEGDDEPGKIATVERIENGSATEYRVVLYDDDDALGDGEIVFLGSTQVQSVSVDVAGELMLVSAASDANGLEVYVFDLAGVLGAAETVYRLPGTPEDEADVSMSLDGDVWAHSSVDSGGMANAVVYVLDRSTDEVFRLPFNIQLGGVRYPMSEPSLSGDGNVLVFAMDATTHALGVEIIVGFQVFGEDGSIFWEATPVSTTALNDPSLSNDASMLLFEEIYDRVEYVTLVDLNTSATEDVFTNDDETIGHAHLAGSGTALVYSLNGDVQRSEIVFGDEITLNTSPVPPSVDGAVGMAPYIARTPPPPPPPPPGTVEYEGSTLAGPTWMRPEGAGFEGPVGYHAYEYTAETDGFYDIISVQDYDGYLYLYEAPFDDEDQLTNLIAANDDNPSAGRSRIRMFLDAGDYVIVTTAWQAGDGGNFENQIIPPQEPAEDAAPTIEFFELDLTVIETGEDVEATWFATSALPITCTIDWGDGVEQVTPCDPGTVESAIHSYATEGPKVVTLTVENDNGDAVAKAFPTVHDEDLDNFDIVVVFANDLLSQTQMDAFQHAADRWAEVITGDIPAAQPGDVPANISCLGEPPFNGPVDDVVISAAGEIIDGPGNVLARAGPCAFRQDGTNGGLEPLPAYGIMQFDVADLDALEDGGGLESTILHEMGHVLGIGPLWGANALLDYEPAGTCNGITNFTSAPVFTGTEATAQYVAFGETGNPPVEDEFGPGTQCSHWDEDTFDNELMTGFLNTGANEPLSAMTVGSLEDLGYEVDYGAADPYTMPAGLMAPAGSHYHGYDITGIFGKHLPGR